MLKGVKSVKKAKGCIHFQKALKKWKNCKKKREKKVREKIVTICTCIEIKCLAYAGFFLWFMLAGKDMAHHPCMQYSLTAFVIGICIYVFQNNCAHPAFNFH